MARDVIKGDKRFTGYYIPVQVLNEFQRLYPRLASTFIRRCLIRACQDQEFFKQVYFTTRDNWSKLGSNNPDYNVLE